MKRWFLVVLAAILGVVLLSCSRTVDVDRRIDDATMRTLTINLDEADLSSQLLTMRNSVSLEDVQRYMNHTSPSIKGGEKDYEIIPQVDEENDTIFYLVQYEKGWKLIASDKRVQPVLAENEEGCYEDAMTEDGPRIWRSILAKEMKIVKHLSDEEFKMPKEEQEAWKKLWTSYSGIDALLEAVFQTKGGIIPPSLEGHYELIQTTVLQEDFGHVGHLTNTKFGQHSPYNTYCPLRSAGGYERSPAGCVAIAGATMLVFLHDTLGVPVYAPSSASVSGNAENPSSINMWQGNYSSAIWNSMISTSGEGTVFVAPLVADIADTIGTTFGGPNVGSHADYLKLKSIALPKYGITCKNSNYVADTAMYYLMHNNPVIVMASESIFDQHGHTFTIDSYRGVRNKVTEVYVWVYDYAGQGYIFPDPDEPIRYVITYINPIVQNIRMNWGADIPDNDTWYTVTGNWQISDSLNGTQNYNYLRKMLYDFKATN